jgi:hypothetical protein
MVNVMRVVVIRQGAIYVQALDLPCRGRSTKEIGLKIPKWVIAVETSR